MKLWVAGKLSEIRNPMTKESDLEIADKKENFLKGVLCGTGRQDLFTGHLMNVG